MMYLGGKDRISKSILPIILRNAKFGQTYVEPFCGGCNTLWKVKGNRVAGDIHYYLIEMWKALQNGWEPKEHYSEYEYWDITTNTESHPPHLIGYVGFCSFGGKWKGGYRKDRKDWITNRTVWMKQAKQMDDVEFHNCHYYDLPIPEKSIIYCDPPYANSTKYLSDKFDTERFWQWARDMTLSGHSVFCSEHTAPDDFKCVWEKELVTTFSESQLDQKTRIEKLFILER
jgi:DNA adenine methylase